MGFIKVLESSVINLSLINHSLNLFVICREQARSKMNLQLVETMLTLQSHNLNRRSKPRKRTGRMWWMQIFTTRMWRHSRLRAHWLMAIVEWGWGRSMFSAFPGNCSVSHLSFVYGRSLSNSLHWKANMLPLFRIMTLWV